jgi:hypothetical protein
LIDAVCRARAAAKRRSSDIADEGDDAAMHDRNGVAPGNQARALRSPSMPNRKKDDPEAARRDRFARAMARAELGRHYWDERRDAELKEAMQKRRAPARSRHNEK